MTTPQAAPELPHVIVLQYSDLSGIIAAFGPYDSKADAEAAEAEMKNWPFEPGLWEIMPIRQFPPKQPPKTVYRGAA